MPQSPLVAKLMKRHAELQEIVAAYHRHISEFQEIAATIEKLKRLFPEEFEGLEMGTPASEQAGPEGTQLPLRIPAQPKVHLSFAVESILESEDRLHAKELLPLLRQRGWIGSGDDKKDIRNIATTLGLRKDVFHNYGGNTWGLESRFQESRSTEEVPL